MGICWWYNRVRLARSGAAKVRVHHVLAQLSVQSCRQLQDQVTQCMHHRPARVCRSWNTRLAVYVCTSPACCIVFMSWSAAGVCVAADQDSVRLLAVESCGAFAAALSKEDCASSLLPVVQKFAQVGRLGWHRSCPPSLSLSQTADAGGWVPLLTTMASAAMASAVGISFPYLFATVRRVLHLASIRSCCTSLASATAAH